MITSPALELLRADLAEVRDGLRVQFQAGAVAPGTVADLQAREADLLASIARAERKAELLADCSSATCPGPAHACHQAVVDPESVIVRGPFAGEAACLCGMRAVAVPFSYRATGFAHRADIEAELATAREDATEAVVGANAALAEVARLGRWIGQDLDPDQVWILNRAQAAAAVDALEKVLDAAGPDTDPAFRMTLASASLALGGKP